MTTLYISKNKIKNWDEIDKLKDLNEIANLNFIGNPIYEQAKEEPLIIFLKKIVILKNIDVRIIDESILERARGNV